MLVYYTHTIVYKNINVCVFKIHMQLKTEINVRNLIPITDKITSAQDRADRYKEADVRTIFVKGLNFSTGEDALKKTFGEKVKEIRLPRDSMGRSRG